MRERQPEDAFINEEVLDPRHTYLAYIFDEPEHQLHNISPLLEKATELHYPIRYWWLSDALDVDAYAMPDRLIVCVHHPSRDEDAGMDLYSSLREEEVEWNELESASFEEYLTFGISVLSPATINRADGQALFSDLQVPFADWVEADNGLELRISANEEILTTLSNTERGNVNAMIGSVLEIVATIAGERDALRQYGGRTLNEQLESVADSFKRTANFYKTHWPHVIRRTIDEDDLPFD